jgi:hypothetical protein
MKQGYTLNAFYVLCVVVVLLAYPVKNYSAIVNRTASVKSVEKVDKLVAEQSSEILHGELLFQY